MSYRKLIAIAGAIGCIVGVSRAAEKFPNIVLILAGEANQRECNGAIVPPQRQVGD